MFGKKREKWIIEKMQAARALTNSIDKKNISFDERFGIQKSLEIKKKLSIARKGKSYIEKFGEEKALVIKEKQRLKKIGTKKTEETKEKMRIAANNSQNKEKRIKIIIKNRLENFNKILSENKYLIENFIKIGLTKKEIQKRINLSRYFFNKIWETL